MIVISRTGRHRALAGHLGTVDLIAGRRPTRRVRWVRMRTLMITAALSVLISSALVWLLM